MQIGIQMSGKEIIEVIQNIQSLHLRSEYLVGKAIRLAATHPLQQKPEEAEEGIWLQHSPDLHMPP